MKKELFEYSPEEASAYMNSEGINELDYVQIEDDEYKIFGESVSSNVKLRIYPNSTYKLEIVVPKVLQCVPCEIDYKTENKDGCPCCGTSNRDVMLRNKVHDEPFRRFEGIYTELLNAALRVARPVCALVADNFTIEQATIAHKEAKEDYDTVLESLKSFSWIFDDNVIFDVITMKGNNTNVESMKQLMGDEITEQSLLDFSK